MSDAPLHSQLEKKLKQKKQKDKGQRNPQQPLAPTPAAIPLLREFLDVPGVPGDPERKLTIMTYNILAQSLIRRELFPHAGNALKRKPRQTLIMDEFNLYKPEIACLQEVDHLEDEYGNAFKMAGCVCEGEIWRVSSMLVRLTFIKLFHDHSWDSQI
ncbi:hypothetical protein BC937DRAFT_87403 [Endogone sp. FLAS-F59071]|nr:hypothetical protein BC937DRAFT_87403 [Endogone sp. FLAS-F59071]|eukprot:RUS19482.1 hypothetical protein BC937DRAFT_87403 [Endogone sp. FLAS-F59071]